MITIAPLLSEAERYLVAHDVDRAAELYRRAHQLDGGRSPLPVVGIARISLLLGRVPEAAALLDKVLASHPGSVEALTIRGAAAEASGDLPAALEWYQRAARSDPTYGPALYNLGRSLAQQGRWPDAVSALTHAARAMDDRPEVLCLLGTAAFRAGDPQRALQALGLALQKDPDSLDAVATMADVLVETGELDLADRLLENAEGRITSGLLPAKRAGIAMRQGRSSDARRHVERQLQQNPQDVEGLLLLAVLATAELDLTAAEKALQQVLVLDPSSWRAHHHLGGLYEALRLRDASLAEYRRAAQLSETAWEPRNNLATLLLEDKQATSAREARTLLEACVAKVPKDKKAITLYNLALATWQLGDKAASEKHAREAVQAGAPGLEVTENARRFLGNFRGGQGARR